MTKVLTSDPLTVAAWKRDDGTPIWITSEGFSVQIGDENGSIVIVERGFETDLGSIPKIVRWLWSPSNPRCARAYVTHDKINQLTNHRPPSENVWSSQVAAGVLYDLMTIGGEPLWSRKLQYLGVVLGIAKKEW